MDMECVTVPPSASKALRVWWWTASSLCAYKLHRWSCLLAILSRVFRVAFLSKSCELVAILGSSRKELVVRGNFDERRCRILLYIGSMNYLGRFLKANGVMLATNLLNHHVVIFKRLIGRRSVHSKKIALTGHAERRLGVQLRVESPRRSFGKEGRSCDSRTHSA